MADLLDGATERFLRSAPYLLRFLKDWGDKLWDRCAGDGQRKAGFLIWSRYTMSIRTLQRLCDPCLMPDIYLIGRACMEFDASLKAVLKDPDQARRYIEYEDKAAAHFGKLLQQSGQATALAQMEPRLRRVFGPDWLKKASTKWANTTEIIAAYGDPDAKIGYAWWSHFAHGSVVAMEFLHGIMPTQRKLDEAIGSIYSSYTLSTSEFLESVWGQIVTIDSDRCKKEFNVVMASNV